MRRAALSTVALAALLLLAGCGASPDTAGLGPAADEAGSEALPSETPVEEAPDSAASEPGGIVVGSTVFPDGVEIRCEDLNVGDLAPWGQKTARTTDTVNLTTFSSCSAEIDTNGDGSATAVDGLTDSGHVTGGLLEKLDGGHVDASRLNDYDVWALCISGARADIPVAEGWDYATACVEEQSIREITYLAVGTTVSGDPATLTCSVQDGAYGFNGREADVERFCSQVLTAANRGTYGD